MKSPRHATRVQFVKAVTAAMVLLTLVSIAVAGYAAGSITVVDLEVSAYLDDYPDSAWPPGEAHAYISRASNTDADDGHVSAMLVVSPSMDWQFIGWEFDQEPRGSTNMQKSLDLIQHVDFAYFTDKSAKAVFAYTGNRKAEHPEQREVLQDKSKQFSYRQLSPAEVEIAGYLGIETHITIPETLDGYNVVGIGSEAFRQLITVRSVSIPSSVMWIADRAFSECFSLNELNLSEGLIMIGKMAFGMCGLSRIQIPDSVHKIGDSAFFYNSSLATIRIGAGLTSIIGNPFSGSSSLTTIDVASDNPSFYTRDGALYMRKQAAADTQNEAKPIETPEINVNSGTTQSATNIPSYNSLELPQIVVNRGNADALQSTSDIYLFPNSITTPEINANTDMAQSATNTPSYNSPELPQIVVNRGNAHALQSTSDIYLFPNSITTPEINANTDTTQSATNNPSHNSPELPQIVLNSANVDELPSTAGISLIPNTYTTPQVHVIMDSAQSTIGVSSHNAQDIPSRESTPDEICLVIYPGMLPGEEFTVQDGTTVIGKEAFFDSNLTRINIPNSVAILGESAFGKCDALVHIQLPEGIQRISDALFYGCSNLQSLQIPQGVQSIGAAAFVDTGILFLALPDGLTDIGANAFGGLSNLSVQMPNVAFEQMTLGEGAFSGVKELLIPNDNAWSGFCTQQNIAYQFIP